MVNKVDSAFKTVIKDRPALRIPSMFRTFFVKFYSSLKWNPQQNFSFFRLIERWNPHQKLVAVSGQGKVQPQRGQEVGGNLKKSEENSHIWHTGVLHWKNYFHLPSLCLPMVAIPLTFRSCSGSEGKDLPNGIRTRRRSRSFASLKRRFWMELYFGDLRKATVQ